MLAEVDLLESVKHPTTKGEHLENVLATFLRDTLPKKYTIGSGFVIGVAKAIVDQAHERQSGRFQSNELDLIVFDEQKNTSPLRLHKKRDFYIESVYAAISVKKDLRTNNLISDSANMIDNLISVKEIVPYSFCHPVSGADTTSDVQGVYVAPPIITIGFAFSGIQLNTIKRHLDRKKEGYGRLWKYFMPDMIVVLGKGLVCIQGRNSTDVSYEIIEKSENTLEEFFIQFLKLLNNRETFVAGIEAYQDFYI